MSVLPKRVDTTIPCPMCKVSLRRKPLGTGWIDDEDGCISYVVVEVEPHRCQKLEQRRREERRGPVPL